MVWYEKVVLFLAALGAINWGLAAVGFNLVNVILGSVPIAETIVYVIIGLCGIWALIKVFKR